MAEECGLDEPNDPVDDGWRNGMSTRSEQRRHALQDKGDRLKRGLDARRALLEDRSRQADQLLLRYHALHDTEREADIVGHLHGCTCATCLATELWRNARERDEDFVRASGDVRCGICMAPYIEHPNDPVDVFLHLLCDGRRVKL